MLPETLCFAATVALLGIVVWLCGKLRGSPQGIICADQLTDFALVYFTGGEFGGVFYAHQLKPTTYAAIDPSEWAVFDDPVHSEWTWQPRAFPTALWPATKPHSGSTGLQEDRDHALHTVHPD